MRIITKLIDVIQIQGKGTSQDNEPTKWYGKTNGGGAVPYERERKDQDDTKSKGSTMGISFGSRSYSVSV